MARRSFVSRIHRKKPPGRPMPEHMRIANAQRSKVRSAAEHVFAHQKGLMGLVVRTISIARARVKIGMGNLAYNIRHFAWLTTKYAAARGSRPQRRPSQNRTSRRVNEIGVQIA